VLLDRFELHDAALNVVGVGGVGTRGWIAGMTARGARDPLFLQIKEADASVLMNWS
jgi:tRNA A37 threonylcarbamoyladenosine dehydratase